jgi:hypothetical protein
MSTRLSVVKSKSVRSPSSVVSSPVRPLSFGVSGPSCEVIASAFSKVLPASGYVVIPVARKVWQPISPGGPYRRRGAGPCAGFDAVHRPFGQRAGAADGGAEQGRPCRRRGFWPPRHRRRDRPPGDWLASRSSGSWPKSARSTMSWAESRRRPQGAGDDARGGQHRGQPDGQVTQQNAAMVEQSTAASHSLSQETAQLSGLIGRFQVGRPSDDDSIRQDLQKVAPHAFQQPAKRAVASGARRGA